jgi:hypothetical protein
VLLAALAVVVPVVLGSVATLAQWHPSTPVAVERDTNITPPASLASVAPVPATQPLLPDGDALLAWPFTGAPVTLRVGQTLELALAPLPGEMVQVLESDAVVRVPAPVCHSTQSCALQYYTRWAFEARTPGIAVIQVDYGIRCRPLLCGNVPASLAVTVIR